jgi:GT2 family glycosyltransferase
MMKLSVVVVNYNVQYFLEQCLHSVQQAIKGIDAEVFVVDNVSKDDSVAIVQQKFPWVKLIVNTENVGFSRANNQAMRVAKGEYVLLLNPDTLVEEDTFKKCIQFMDERPDAGALGVKMVDGKGQFLEESKRGIPFPSTSFFKISGIYKLFPRSAFFNHYYLGHLSKEDNQEIEILSGAFMFMRKSALDKVGLLDEDFFMYGEDIDLSWRILQGGFKNHYLADTRIIHYKGESTKKGSLNYVYVFYQAMEIFANKHFGGSYAKWFHWMIKVAIWMRAGISFGKRIVQKSFLPMMDIGVTLSVWWLLKSLYSDVTGIVIRDNIAIPAFCIAGLFWLIQGWIQGLYDTPFKTQGVVKALGRAGFFLLVLYSLLPETWRFSRLLIIVGSLLAMVVFWTLRWLLQKLQSRGVAGVKKVLIIGESTESSRVKSLLVHYAENTVDLSPLHFRELLSGHALSSKIRIEEWNTVVFCAKDLTSEEIISAMSQLSSLQIEMKIAPPETYFLIGSQTIDGVYHTPIVELNSIASKENQRKKRLLDVLVSLFLMTTGWIWVKKFGFKLVHWSIQVLIRQKSWVSYSNHVPSLPKLPIGFFNPSGSSEPNQDSEKADMLYAKDYHWSKDLRLIWECLSR